jgi:two-component system chemotaxis response regulator CheY
MHPRTGESSVGLTSEPHDSSQRPSRQLELEVSLLGSDQDGVQRVASRSESDELASGSLVEGAGAIILLVVEDSEMRGYLRGCLVHETADIAAVLEADSLSTAKQRAAAQLVDLVIADGGTVGGSGPELNRALRDESEFTTLPVILVVDEPISDEMRRSSNASLRILARPFNAARLCDAVRTTIRDGAKPNHRRVNEP